MTTQDIDIDLEEPAARAANASFDMEELETQLNQVESAIKAQSTQEVSQLIIKIHSNLLKKPELLMTLPEDKVAVLIKGIEKTVNRQIIEGTSNKSPKKKYRDSDLDLDL